MTTDVIHDTQNVIVEKGLELDSSGNTVTLTEEDYREVLKKTKRLKTLIKNAKDSKEDLVFIFRGSSYKLIKEFSFVSLPDKEEDTNTCELILKFRKDKNRVELTYSIFRHSTSGIPSISITGNPTTLMNGHNTSPLLLSDNASTNLKLYYQIPFLFLFEVLDFKPSMELKGNIKRCIIQANNVQWAMYLPCRDKDRTLDALKLIYGRPDVATTTVKGKKKRKILCNYLGFNYSLDQNLDYEGFFMSKSAYNGARILTVNLYDKTESNLSNKISGLTVEEKYITDRSLRLDLTAHRPFLLFMIDSAKKIAKEFIKTGNFKYFTADMLQKFVDSSDTRAWASNIVMAMLLLPFKKDKEKKWVKSSFSAWLKHKILIDMMKLDLLLKFSGSIDTSTLTSSEKEFFNLWKEGEEFHRSLNYAIVANMEKKLGLNTDIPFRMLEAIIILDSVYGLEEDEDRWKYSQLLSKKKKSFITNTEAQELADLQVKSSKNIMQSRVEMAETFGISLMPPVSDKRHLLASV